MQQNIYEQRAPTQKEFVLFKQLVAEKTGIHLPHTKIALLNSRIGKRLAARDCQSFTEYYELIHQKHETQEMEMAINQITTNETFFFREEKHFSYLKEHIIPNCKKSMHFRVWSAACSTGQEPYSIAMTLAEHCTSPWSIVASDINTSVVNIARRAIYPNDSSQNIPKHLKLKYCLKGNARYKEQIRISPTLRDKVEFMQLNLLEEQSTLGMFDLIFLRNVMIYFEKPTQQRVTSNLQKRLKSGGYLFVGHSESLHGISSDFKMIKPAVYRLK